MALTGKKTSSRNASLSTSKSQMSNPSKNTSSSTSKSQNSLAVPPSSAFSFSAPRSSARDLRTRSPARLNPGFVATPSDGRRTPQRPAQETNASVQNSSEKGASRDDTDEDDEDEDYNADDNEEESDDSVVLVAGSPSANLRGKRALDPSQPARKKAGPRSSVGKKQATRKKSLIKVCTS